MRKSDKIAETANPATVREGYPKKSGLNADPGDYRPSPPTPLRKIPEPIHPESRRQLRQLISLHGVTAIRRTIDEFERLKL